MIENVIDDRYKRESLLGEGNFGKVYLCKDLESGKFAAVKLEQSSKDNQLENEARVLQDLNNTYGFPKYYGSKFTKDYCYLAMELLGPSINDKFVECRKRFSLKTVTKLAKSMLLRVKSLHENGYIHRDLKPQQFLLGPQKDSDSVFLVDFGLSKRYKTKDLGIHVPYMENRAFVGTTYYASVNTHKGIQQSRRDDLETLCYLFSYFLKGTLPWKNKTKEKITETKIRSIKTNTSPIQLFSDSPREFFYLMSYVKNLQYDSSPDYNYMIHLLDFVSQQFNCDEVPFDWVGSKDFKKSSTKRSSSPKKPKRKRNKSCKPLCLEGNLSFQEQIKSISRFTNNSALYDEHDQTVVASTLPEFKNREIIAFKIPRKLSKKVFRSYDIERPRDRHNCFIF